MHNTSNTCLSIVVVVVLLIIVLLYLESVVAWLNDRPDWEQAEECQDLPFLLAWPSTDSGCFYF
jgi:hypothetical protein